MASSLPRFQSLTEFEDEPKRRLAEELVRSNAELEAFAYRAAHDIREPLRTISAYTELLAVRAKLDEADREIARFVVEGVRRLASLVDELLSSAVHGFNESLHVVQLERVAAQAIESLGESIRLSGATINVDTLPTVEASEHDLFRVFQNLISNAIKYRSEAALVIHITAECAGPEWIIKVRDNGLGIAEEQRRRIFGLFRRGHHETVPGTGIGLAVCKKIVEGLGGVIWVVTETGVGSTFCFTLAVRSYESGWSLNGNATHAPEPMQRH